MSLFATDATLLGPSALVASAVSAASAADRAWTTQLPFVIDAALRRGHVRAAALLHEVASSHLDLDSAALRAARVLIDHTAAADAAMQRLQLEGDAVVIPSLTEVSPGQPRFLVGLHWDELSHPDVQDFVKHELVNGHQAELRNFLDDVLSRTDEFIDLDPGVGVGVLTALTVPTNVATVRVVQRDPMLHAILQRNVHRVSDAPTVELLSSAQHAKQGLFASAGASRSIIHVGSRGLDGLHDALADIPTRAVAIACMVSGDARTDTLSALTQAGCSLFVLVSNASEFELMPFEDECGAAYVFALSPRFVASLEASTT